METHILQTLSWIWNSNRSRVFVHQIESLDGSRMGCARIWCVRKGHHGTAANTLGTRRPLLRASRSEAVLIGGAILSVSTHGHLHEVWDVPYLRVRLVHADGPLTSIEVHHEATKDAIDPIGFGVLLVAVLSDSSCCQDRVVKSEDWEA